MYCPNCNSENIINYALDKPEGNPYNPEMGSKPEGFLWSDHSCKKCGFDFRMKMSWEIFLNVNPFGRGE